MPLTDSKHAGALGTSVETVGRHRTELMPHKITSAAHHSSQSHVPFHVFREHEPRLPERLRPLALLISFLTA